MQLLYYSIPPLWGLYCFWCPNKTWILHLSASNAPRIVKNGLQMTKLWPPKVKGVKNSKKNHWKLQRLILKHPKSSFYVALFLLDLEDDLKNFKFHSYSTLNGLKWIRNKKVMRFESRRGLKRKKNEKKTFCNLESLCFLFSSC
jgi:hypothetical protein